jgi:SAM-dependent methyltransferase
MQILLLLIIILLTEGSVTDPVFATMMTHEDKSEQKKPVFDRAQCEERLRSSTNLALPLDEELQLLQQMTEFEFGRYLLENRGISGYWTAYWLIHGPQKKLEHPLEDWLINKAPQFMASRERLKLFAAETQQRIKPGMKLGSVPCGLMDDLLRLDYSQAPGVELHGFDFDPESIRLAEKNAEQLGKMHLVTLHKADAWNLEMDGQLDLITSNGLNFYVQDDAKVVELYKEFNKALRNEGILVTSFLTPIPTWKPFNPADVVKTRAIFLDLMQARWTALRSEELTRQQLEAAGFKVLKVIYDEQSMFPTIIAQKVGQK